MAKKSVKTMKKASAMEFDDEVDEEFDSSLLEAEEAISEEEKEILKAMRGDEDSFEDRLG